MPMLESNFASFLDSKDGKEPNVLFQWFYHRFDSEHLKLANLTNFYTELLQQATKIGEGLSGHAATASLGAAYSHNMILTKRWMVVLPRR